MGECPFVAGGEPSRGLLLGPAGDPERKWGRPEPARPDGSVFVDREVSGTDEELTGPCPVTGLTLEAQKSTSVYVLTVASLLGAPGRLSLRRAGATGR